MPRDDLMKRMEILNGEPLRNVPAEFCNGGSPNTSTPSAELAHSVTSARKMLCGPAARVTLEQALSGVHYDAPIGPGFYLVEKDAVGADSKADWVASVLRELIAADDSAVNNRIAAILGNRSLCPEEVLFLDIETTGLSMAPLFLIGTMELGKDSLNIRQYFARNYSEEISILSAVSERLEGTRLLVTFNGKSFDMPYMHDRANAVGIDFRPVHWHLDLLHEARKVYRGIVPNYRLQTLEQYICGRYRENDIPGSEIPSAYHEFVITGDASKIRAVIEHNVLDLFTMAELVARMCGREP